MLDSIARCIGPVGVGCAELVLRFQFNYAKVRIVAQMTDMNLSASLIMPSLFASLLSLTILFLAVAERIAAERGENVGDTVGYQVSFIGSSSFYSSYNHYYKLVLF